MLDAGTHASKSNAAVTPLAVAVTNPTAQRKSDGYASDGYASDGYAPLVVVTVERRARGASPQTR